MDELALCFALCTVLIIIVILVILHSRKARCHCGAVLGECSCSKCPDDENFTIHSNTAKSGLPPMKSKDKVIEPLDQMYGDAAYAGINIETGETDQTLLEHNMLERSAPVFGQPFSGYSGAQQKLYKLPDVIDDDTLLAYSKASQPTVHMPYDPTPNDSAPNHKRGDIWHNHKTDDKFVLVDHSPGYAKWHKVLHTAPMNDRTLRPRPMSATKFIPVGGVRQYASDTSKVTTNVMAEKTSQNGHNQAASVAAKKPKGQLMNLITAN